MTDDTIYRRTFTPPEASGSAVELRLYYSPGGYNYMTNQPSPRGLWLSLQPMTVRVSESNPAIQVQSFEAFSGQKVLLSPMPRRKRTFFDEVKDKLAPAGPEIADAFFEGGFADAFTLVRALFKELGTAA